MPREHLSGYTIRPSPGSKRGQKCGSASGHTIPNEGEVTYSFMTEHGAISNGTSQVGAVRRPLAAVSKITKANNFVFFSQGCDYIIDGNDELVGEILKLIKEAKMKTKLHEHKGTYRMRAWLIPEERNGSQGSAA